MLENDPPIEGVTCSGSCTFHWCCSTRCFSAPPICLHEIARIERVVGCSDFCGKIGSQYALRVKENGYCIFFDEQKRTCKIYEVRPFDCQIFPFDFFASGLGEGVWLLWNCPYSRQLDEATIKRMLTDLEKNYAKEIIETWDYGNDDYAGKLSENRSPTEGFRILRKMNLRRDA